MVAPDKIPFTAANVLESRVLSERVRVLYEISPYGYAAALIGIAIAAFGLHGVVANWLLVAWSMLQLLAVGGRHAVYVAYRRAADKATDAPAWERYFAAAAGLAGFGWGLLALLLMPEHSIPHQMLVVFIVAVMTLAGMASMHASRLAFGWFAMPAMVGLVWELTARGGALYLYMAALAAALFALMFYLFQRINRNLQNMLAGRFENDALIEDLSQTERNLHAAIEEQRLIFDTVAIGIMYVESRDEMRITRCNRGLEAMLGYEPGELVSRSTRVLHPSEEMWRSTVAEFGASLAATGEHRADVQLVRKDGSEAWCRMTGRLVEPGKAAQGVIWIFEDLTGQRAAQEAQRGSELRLDLAMNASPAGMWDWDLALDRQVFSARFRELLGYHDAAEFDRVFSFRDHLHPEDAGRVLGAIERHLDKREPFEDTFRLRCRDGSHRWFLARGQAQWDENGRAARFAGAISDVTLLREREAALELADASAKEAIAEEHALLETALIGVAFLRDSEVQRCNPRFARMFGYEEAELTGRSIGVLFPSAEDFAASSVRAWRAIETLGAYREERAFLRKDGSETWCSLAGQYLDRADPEKGVIWIAEDLAERKHAERELRRSEERLALALRASDSGIWDRDFESDSAFYSPRYRELLGYRDLSNARFCEQFNGREALHPEDRERVTAAVKRALETRQPFAEIYRLRCRDGSYRWFHGHAHAQYDAEGRPLRYAGSITDVTGLHEREIALAGARAEIDAANDRLRDAIESIPDPFALFDSGDRLALCNRVYAQTFAGVDRAEDIVGRTFEELVRASVAGGQVVPPEFDGGTEAWIAEAVRRHSDPSAGEALIQTSAGRWFQVRERRTREGGIVGVRTDVTDLKASEARVRYLSQHDPLTGLPNRRLLQDRMEQAFVLARRNKTRVAILLVDLDRFKVINDIHGHRIGDEVLREVANRLRASVREADTVARHGGDEFVVLLPELQRALDATRVADKAIESLIAPIRVDGADYSVSASIGISIYPVDGQESDTLLWQADQAMYRMKQEGGSGVRFVSPQED